VVSFRSGGKITYGIAGMGYNHKTKGNSLVLEGGMGVHIDLTSWFGINQEIKCETVGISSKEKDMTWKSGYFLLPTFRIAPHFDIFGGPGINYLHTRNIANAELFPSHSCGKSMALPNFSKCMLVIRLAFNMSFKFASGNSKKW
jgi:hypothetical protein